MHVEQGGEGEGFASKSQVSVPLPRVVIEGTSKVVSSQALVITFGKTGGAKRKHGGNLSPTKSAAMGCLTPAAISAMGHRRAGLCAAGHRAQSASANSARAVNNPLRRPIARGSAAHATHRAAEKSGLSNFDSPPTTNRITNTDSLTGLLHVDRVAQELARPDPRKVVVTISGDVDIFIRSESLQSAGRAGKVCGRGCSLSTGLARCDFSKEYVTESRRRCTYTRGAWRNGREQSEPCSYARTLA